MPLCPDLKGEIGSLETVNPTVGSSAAFPIDLVVADFGAIVVDDDGDNAIDAVSNDND